MEEQTIDIINNLASTRTDAALAALQGRVLNEKILAIQEALESVATNADIDAIFA